MEFQTTLVRNSCKGDVRRLHVNHAHVYSGTETHSHTKTTSQGNTIVQSFHLDTGMLILLDAHNVTCFQTYKTIPLSSLKSLLNSATELSVGAGTAAVLTYIQKPIEAARMRPLPKS